MSDHTSRKFEFDTVFDLAGNIVEEGSSWRQSISKAQSEQQVTEAFDRGRAAEKAEVEKTTAEAIDALQKEVSKLISQTTQIESKIRNDAAHLTMVIAQKIANVALNHFAFEQIRELIEQTLSECKKEPRIRILVAPELVERLQSKMQEISDAAEFIGTVRVEPTEDAAMGAVALEWSDGAVGYDPKKIETRIEAEMLKWLAMMEPSIPEPTQKHIGDNHA